MSVPAQLEHDGRRLGLQAGLDAAKTPAERNRLGQFATPSCLADEILHFAQRLMAPDVPIRWLDPGFGTGAFYAALLRVFGQDRVVEAVGYEVDPHYGEPARHLWRDTSVQIRLEDFTRAQPPVDAERRSNLIICNPPYVRHHHLDTATKARLHDATRISSGMSLSGLAGLYCYFLGLAHSWLAPGGLAGWLIPSEWMTVNYGRAVQRYLLDRVTLHRVHRFDPADAQFGDAIVSSVVVWFTNTPPPLDHRVELTFGGTLTVPRVSSLVPATDLRRTAKWTRYPQIAEGDLDPSHYYTMGDLFRISRGVATGSNGYFVLKDEQVAEYQLPRAFLRPILPAPRHLKGDEVLSDAAGIPILDRRLWLLDCNLPEATIQAEYPTLWKYLQRGIERGIPGGYLCTHRTPWYSQERRPAAPIVCTYMARDNGGGRPFRFIRNDSAATAPNVYLMLYPRPPLAHVLSGRPELLRLIWEALNDIPMETLIGEGRVYGGGLHKLEPRELARAPADGVAGRVGWTPTRRAEQLQLLEPRAPYC